MKSFLKIALSVFILSLSFYANAQIVGGGAKCYTSVDPNTMTTTLPGVVNTSNCVEVYDTVANIHYSLDRTAPLGQRWKKWTGGSTSGITTLGTVVPIVNLGTATAPIIAFQVLVPCDNDIDAAAKGIPLLGWYKANLTNTMGMKVGAPTLRAN